MIRRALIGGLGCLALLAAAPAADAAAHHHRHRTTVRCAAAPRRHAKARNTRCISRAPRRAAAVDQSGGPAPVPVNGQCPGADAMPAPDNVDTLASTTMCLVNQQRLEHGLGALRPDARLAAAARHHTDDMVAADYFDHTSPTGETAVQRVLDTGFVPAGYGYELGENLAWGTGSYATPRDIVAAWMQSPGHRENILNGNYTVTGLALSEAVPASLGAGPAGGIYTQEFGDLIAP